MAKKKATGTKAKKALTKASKPKKKAAVKRRRSTGATPVPRGPEGVDLDKTVLTYVAQPNPKRVGTASHERYKLYREGMTLQEVMNAGIKMAHLRWDIDKDHVQLKLVKKSKRGKA